MKDGAPIFHIFSTKRTVVDHEIFSLPSRFDEILVFFLVYQVIDIFFLFEVTSIVVQNIQTISTIVLEPIHGSLPGGPLGGLEGHGCCDWLLSPERKVGARNYLTGIDKLFVCSCPTSYACL
jgi:hypothetical protein